jgi:hypothetical protein
MADTQKTELVKLRYSHVEAVFTLAIVAVIVVGGFVCMVKKIEGGQTIVVGVIGVVTGWVGAKRMSRPRL